MKEFTAYLMFNGNCRQAMEFYAKYLGGDLQVMPYSDGPADMPKEMKNSDKVLHARLSKAEQTLLMASDCPPDKPVQVGNNFSVSIACDSNQEVDDLFKSLGEGGKVTMPVQNMFWGAYFGMLTDKFGVNWMFNHDTKQS